MRFRSKSLAAVVAAVPLGVLGAGTAGQISPVTLQGVALQPQALLFVSP